MIFNPGRWLACDLARSGGAASNYANLTFRHGTDTPLPLLLLLLSPSPRSLLSVSLPRCRVAAKANKPSKTNMHQRAPLLHRSQLTRAEFVCLVAILIGSLEVSFAKPGGDGLEQLKGGITHRLRDELRLKDKAGGWYGSLVKEKKNEPGLAYHGRDWPGRID